MVGASASAMANPESQASKAIADQELGPVVHSGDGVEFRVRFGRENNKPVAFFTAKNTSGISYDVIPFRFQVNYFALAPGGAIPSLPAGQTVTTAIPLVNSPDDFEGVPANRTDGTILCAAKLNTLIPKFQITVPPEILFSETGALEQSAWLAEWKSNTSLQVVNLSPFAVPGADVASLKAKLAAKNVTCLAVRQINGQDHCFLSAYWRHTPVLAEMIVGGGNVSFNVRAASKKVADIAANALKAIVTK